MSVGKPELSVLLIEDEELIGLDLCDLLETAGYRTIGPVGRVAEALQVLSRTAPHLAIMDIELRDGSCWPLVDRLRARSIPFLIHSGHRDDGGSPVAAGDVPWLTKPASSADLIDTLRGLSMGRG